AGPVDSSRHQMPCINGNGADRKTFPRSRVLQYYADHFPLFCISASKPYNKQSPRILQCKSKLLPGHLMKFPVRKHLSIQTACKDVFYCKSLPKRLLFLNFLPDLTDSFSQPQRSDRLEHIIIYSQSNRLASMFKIRVLSDNNHPG